MKDKSLKISVITVAFNAAKTIAETLNSVISQTHNNIEYIVIDGNSTDDSLLIINQYKEFLSLVISEPDKGLYDAMNKGISLATGEIIAILNADDIYENNEVLSNICKIMSANNSDAVIGDVIFFNKRNPKKSIRRYDSSYFSPSKIQYGWMPAHPAMFLKRSVYERFGLYKTDYKIAADFEFVARVFSRNAIKYSYVPQVFVRMQTGGISTGSWQNRFLLNFECLRACRENKIDTNILMILSRYPRKIFEINLKNYFN